MSEIPSISTDTVSPDADSSIRATKRLGSIEVAVTALTVCLALAMVPQAMFPSWTPRFALLSVASLPGLVLLIRSIVERDGLALRAGTVIAAFVISVLFSGAIRSSAIGYVGRDLSLLTVVAAFGVWSLARSVEPDAVPTLTAVFVGAASVVAGLGVVQVVAGIENGSLALQEGRPMATLVNPVYFGAVCAAGAVAAVRSAPRSIGLFHGAAALATVATVVSGSRVAWAAVAVLVVAQVVEDRSRARVSGAVAAATGAGAGLALDRVFSDGSNSVDRIAGGGGGGRLTIWEYGLESWLERPLLGHGLGTFRAVVQDRFSYEFVRTSALDDSTQPWFDAHNLVVGVLAAGGVVGLLALAFWIVSCVRAGAGPAGWAAAAIAITWSLQPVSLHTLPIAMTLLGISVATGAPTSRATRSTVGVAAALAVVLAGVVVANDFRLRAAVDDRSLSRAEAVATWFPDDAIVANVVAQIARLDLGPTAGAEEILRWRRLAVEREPDRPTWWNLLGEEQLRSGDVEGAAASVESALALQPTNFRANLLGLQVAGRLGNEAAAEARLVALCRLDDQACDLTVADVVGVAAGG